MWRLDTLAIALRATAVPGQWRGAWRWEEVTRWRRARGQPTWAGLDPYAPELRGGDRWLGYVAVQSWVLRGAWVPGRRSGFGCRHAIRPLRLLAVAVGGTVIERRSG